MTAGATQRAVALAAVALVAAVLALAVTDRGEPTASGTPKAKPVPAANGGWYRALAGARPPAADAERTSCGDILTGRSLGVTHPVLPCGAKIFIAYGDREVLTEVIDRGPVKAGRQFELTQALAAKLGLEGTQEIRWRFAAPA